MKLVLAFLTLSLMAQDATPPPSTPPKAIEQQLADAKAENVNLRKLLAEYDKEYNTCHAAFLQLQVLGSPQPAKPERPR